MMQSPKSSLALLVSTSVAVFIVLLHLCGQCDAELTPPYFNLAEGRKITASSTCGVDSDGPELYCKLVGSDIETNINGTVINGQICDYCDPTRPDRSHPAEYAIDGTASWWQSPPLSRGMKYNEVNLTIDFGQEFHVAYIFVRMANSPRPSLYTLEKSSDYGKTWRPWQHFSDTPADCETFFGRDSLKPITADDDVICTTEFSKIVPLEDGEIPIRLLNNRPSAKNYFNSTVLQEWTRATNVRFRFYRTKNLLGHLMSVVRQDPTVTRRYFYSIKDISIGGRCMCNGHADTCHVLDPLSPTRILACQCRHNTGGIHCNECASGYEQKKWRQNTKARPFQCEACNCFGHSNTCVYNETIDNQGLSLDIHGRFDGGGVCQYCQHNTKGINCNKCESKFYRPWGKHWNETDVCRSCNCENFFSTGNCEEETGRCECRPEFQEPDCQSCSYGHYGYPNCRPCECNLSGTDGYYCESTNGTCPCKPNFTGDYCNRCADGYYGPDCLPCNCDLSGSLNDVCDFVTGQCPCSSQFDGTQCERCKDGYFNFPSCPYCNCDLQGTLSEICDKDAGKCLCKEGYGGPRCDQCIPGYYNYPECVPCSCSKNGSASTVCDATGKCPCLSSFAGKQCTLCSAGYHSYPDCLPCFCESPGSNGISCNADGQCSCFENFDGKVCGQCKEGFYNFPACEECNCDPAGVTAKFSGCASMPAGELCQCKERVSGRICDDCKPLYWNLNITNPDGCDECDCFVDGTIAGLDTCDSKSGQCACKPSVHGRECGECKDGSFDLFGSNLFGCRDCGCDIGGSINEVCNKVSGQCKCHPRIAGQTCSHPLTTHYYPTLHQNQFEYEDGYTPNGALVRYEFEEAPFPGFSKRGYAKFTKIQQEVRNEVNIFRSSVYRMVIRFVNPTNESTVAIVKIVSDNPNESEQESKVLLVPTTEPQFVTVSGAKGKIPSAIVLDPGRYTFSVQTNKFLYLDYFVLLPAAYYEASILTRKIETPCEIGNLELCRHYKYPSILDFNPSYDSFITGDDNQPIKTDLIYADSAHLALIDENNLSLLNGQQQKLNYILNVPQSGRYIVVIDYVTERQWSETYIIKVKLLGSDQPDGFVTLYSCLYTTVCRQPVVDDDSREQVFFIDVSDLKPIQIIGDEASHNAIKSIAAIPVHEWSIDLITPSPVCVIKDGECVQEKYLAAPDSKKIEFETNNEERIAETNPSGLPTDDLKLIYLDQNNSTVEIRSKVSGPGRYHIVIKFYQPNNAKFDISYKIDADKNVYDGKLILRNCPSNSGCRETIEQNNGWKSFDIEENVTIIFTNTRPKGVWLDYILIIPDDQFNENLLREEKFDQTIEFIQKCGQNHFHIQLNASDFCKQAVFSLTSDYNNGALPCNCDYEGSTSFECDPFGGQCQCKPDIIGRQCDACRTGFYGFPDCKPCDCPSKSLCEKETGACICAPHVIGERCDKCEPYTFGFDQYFGCELCNCDPLGVVDNDLQCDLNNGTCNCLRNIEGRTCDKCRNGFFNFPQCQQCRCSIEGTTYEICDPVDETCFCKKNVQGAACDTCVDGTYNLQKLNPEGCTNCFCFGKTTRCDRAYLRAFNVSMLKEVSVNTIALNTESAELSVQRWEIDASDIFVNETTLEADLSLRKSNDDLVYFGVLDYLLDQNNHLTAYGGLLTYTLYSTSGLFGKALNGPDVILEGKHLTILHQSYEQPASERKFYGNIRFIESSFKTIDGRPVSRDDFMHILRDLNAIYIRSTYWDHTVISQLTDVYLLMADDDEENYSLYEELSIENCHCPPGYVGHSCEDCAPGYYRDPNGPHGGYCVPCQCNNHADTCDCNTGICNSCTHSTYGDHCENCISGYYGNATLGTPNDCLICACPLPIESNNFATGCEISEDGRDVSCTCHAGYAGELCEECAPGYYGNPREPGNSCRPCECHDNIDTNEEDCCNRSTGECLKCLNNTFGSSCEICGPGFYGDALIAKNCTNCICDPLGMEYCDRTNGTCHCQPNVVGPKCDRCEIDHYGFDSGRGCTACECGIASNSSQCDDHTGECRCKPGATGRQCDSCLPGYWNYTNGGCLSCNCNDNYSRGVGCNVQTGQCSCLPGVVGEKCDACPHRWVLVPDHGCHDCDICHHGLLDVTDELAIELKPVIDDFQSVADGFFTSQKLKYFNELADSIEPQVKALDPNEVNLTPLGLSIDALELDAKNYERKVRYANETANDQLIGGLKLLNDSRSVLAKSRLTVDNTRNIIYEVEKLADSFDTSESTKIEAAMGEANELLDHLLEVNIDTTPAENQLAATAKYLLVVEKFNEPVQRQAERLENIRATIGNFSDKLENLAEWSAKANELCDEAERLHFRNKNATVNLKFDTVANHSKETQSNIDDVSALASKGKVTLGDIFIALNNLENVNNELKEINGQVDAGLPKREDEYKALEDIINQSDDHQTKLQNSAAQLHSELTNIAANSENANKAAHAYTNIAERVNSALESARNAKASAGNATDLTSGIDGRAGAADQLSSAYLDRARQSLQEVQADLKPHLDNSAAVVDKIKESNDRSDTKTTAINAILDQLPGQAQTELWETARDKAIDAQEKAAEAKQILSPIVGNLPNDLTNANQMPKKVDDTNLYIAEASTQIDRVSRLLPQLTTLVDDLSERQDNIEKIGSDLGDRIDRLKKQIEIAHDIANGIKVGVQFHPNTTLELAPPANLEQLATSSRVSAYVRTEKPNGFLLYLGNERKPDGGNRGGKHDDFMALEIENGYPILIIDLGNGPQRIVGNKNIANGQWHQVIVERTGNDVKLTVRDQLDDGKDSLHEKEEVLEGPQTVFDLNRENSKLFVGGYPPDFSSNSRYNSFEGEIEDLRIGDQEVGLWNFVDGQNNNHGAVERDRLITSDIPPTGYRFSGHGYVMLDAKPYQFKQRSSIHFKFKAGRDTTDGLMFYAGKHRHFIAVEMRNGQVWFQYKLGQHIVSMGTDHQFNDDEWHRVEAERDGRAGQLKIDNVPIYQEESPVGTEENLKITDTLYFGGHPDHINHTEVVKKNFDGCIDDVQIAGTPVDLSHHLKAYGVRPGCPTKFSNTLSFAPHQHGYLRRGNVSVPNSFYIDLKFKTRQKEGIVFYATDAQQANTIGLWLEDGALVLRSQNVEVRTTPTTYIDGNWHHVIASHDANKLTLVVDEAPDFVSQLNTNNLYLENADIYFAGLPDGTQVERDALQSPAYFVGCISYVVLNGQLVNFAESIDRKSAVLDNCARDLLDYDPELVPIYYPDRSPEAPIKNEIDSKSNEAHPSSEDDTDEDLIRLEEKERERQRLEDEEERRRIEAERQREREDEENHVIPSTPEYLTTTTTTRPTKRRPTKLDPICKLPVEPELDVDFDAGYRFGTSGDSRIEFAQIQARVKKSYEFSLQFNTGEANGVLFYAEDDYHSDFIGLYLKNGYLVHSFSCGSGSANMTSKFEYNNNQWHTVLFSRQQTQGRLLVNGEDESIGESVGSTRAMAVQGPYYVGGVNPNILQDLNNNLGLEKDDFFRGCIRNIQASGRDLGEASQVVGVQPCSEQIESGIFFGKGGGHIKLRDRFKVGIETTIYMEIKPRTMNGLLLSVHGKKALLLLQLINGTVHLTVNNGDDPTIAIFKPESNQNFCDGEWHSIKAIKSQYVITLIVDGVNSEPAIGKTTSLSTDTTRPLFLGGHPYLSKARGLTVRRPFLGCIRNVRIKDQLQNIQPGMTVGHVQTGVCPLN